MLMKVRAKAACDERAKFETYALYGTELEVRYDLERETATEEKPGTILKDRLAAEDWLENLPKVPASWKDGCIPYLNADIWACVRVLFTLLWFRRV